jgi:hypothetical protein
MTTAQESKTNIESALPNRPISVLRHQMLETQKDDLVACIREFFDEGDACGPVCFLNDLMQDRISNAEGLRISSFLMRLQRFDRCITVIQTP